jgi:phenylalanyl-tRNA synthetase beta chain
VCGGSNVVEGMKVALGKIGAKVRWHGEGELVELAKVKIRGVESFGMICAASEIGLGDIFPATDEREILDLSHLSVKPGTTVAKALGMDDIIFDIDNKSLTHRPDLCGHYGLARELSALYNYKLQPYEAKEIKPGQDCKLKVRIENKELCPRYMAVMIDGIKVEPSPSWLQKKLLAAGLHPINNIVDITT